jgi:N-acyl-D-amino-acid deacylase
VSTIAIRGGRIYDGSGGAPFRGDVLVEGDTIRAVQPGTIQQSAEIQIDASGLAVAPGFINMLSWAPESLIQDGRSQSDIRQGVTLEVFGEGESMGPLNVAMQEDYVRQQTDVRYAIEWTTLGEYLDWLAHRGISTNVASFVGASTVRMHVLGHAHRVAAPDEVAAMCNLVRGAMQEGALGVGSALIYPPGFYADTDELVALATAAAEYGGTYISHVRSEGAGLLDAVDELIEIAQRACIPAEIYHLKTFETHSSARLDAVIGRIEQARAAGLAISADMYPYAACSTGLDACMPPWVQEGGHTAWVERLKTVSIRNQVIDAMRSPATDWENMYALSGSPDNILLVGFKSDRLKPLSGKTLAQIAQLRGATPEATVLDLVIQDDSRVLAVYFAMSEDNVRKQIALPWVSFGSDAPSLAPEGVFLQSLPHPRAYGTFARVLGRYVREQRVISLQEAIRRLTTLPARNLRLARRGALAPGYFADIVVFDPAAICDRATFDRPHQYATGMRDVLVNGVRVLRDGEHTGARPGRVVRRSSPTGVRPAGMDSAT